MKSRCDEVHYVDEVENLCFRLGICSNEIPKDRDEVTDVMKSAARMKSKTVFSVGIKSTYRRGDFIRALARTSSAEQIYSTVRWI